MSLPRRLPLAGLLAGAALFVTGPGQAQQPAAPPAGQTGAPASPSGGASVQPSVNGTPITEADIKAAEEDIGSSLPAQISPEQKRDYLIGYAIDLRLAAAEAEKQKILSQAEIDQRLAYYKQKILMDGLMGKAAKDAATDEAMKKLYDETVKSIPPEDEVHARHILLEKEEDAKKAYDRVKGGEDFAKVAKELSKDPGSADGGDLGWFTKDRMVKDFAEAAFALKPGEISQPVKSQFGWHIIKVEERRAKAPPPLEQVKPQIEQYLMRKAQQDLILKLREGAKIVKPEPPKGAMPLPGGGPEDEDEDEGTEDAAPAPGGQTPPK